MGPVIQANGSLSFEDGLRCVEACFTVFHSKPASALSLLTVWSLWVNPEMTCKDRSEMNVTLTALSIMV